MDHAHSLSSRVVVACCSWSCLKDITKFQFPMELDMRSFMESIREEQCYSYELFSVIIHR